MVPYVVASGLTSQTTSSAALTEALMELEKANHSVTPVMTSETTTLGTTATKKGRKRRKRPLNAPLNFNESSPKQSVETSPKKACPQIS
uniref:Uncharacterized protein n=1 Tax=Panagrellus redivivus TaxID=6233 RepID=A0A7E4VHQ3_PANRE